MNRIGGLHDTSCAAHRGQAAGPAHRNEICLPAWFIPVTIRAGGRSI